MRAATPVPACVDSIWAIGSCEKSGDGYAGMLHAAAPFPTLA